MSVRVPVVIVEHEDGEDHTGRHHALDEVEIGPCTPRQLVLLVFNLILTTYQGHGVACDGHQLRHNVHEDSEGEEDSHS